MHVHPSQASPNNAKHSDSFSLRLRLHHKAARVGGVMRVMKAHRLMLLLLSALTGCTAEQDHRNKPETARGETPIRYVICSAGGGNCFVSSRFSDFESCESHKSWSNMLCDSKSQPGKMVCTPGDDIIAVAYCTK